VVMDALDRVIIAALWAGRLKWNDNQLFVPRSATVGDLRLFRPLTGRWHLSCGEGVAPVRLGIVVHTYIELLRRNRVCPRLAAKG